jgi:hypothetical protein
MPLIQITLSTVDKLRKYYIILQRTNNRKMAKVIYMEDIISKNRHLENQDVFEISSRAN